MSVSRVSNATAATAVAGLHMVTPTSVTVGSGTGSVSGQGLVTFTGASSVSLNGCFTSLYENYRVVTNSIGSGTGLRIRLRSSGSDNASNNCSFVRQYQDTAGTIGFTNATGNTVTYMEIGGVNATPGMIEITFSKPNILDYGKGVSSIGFQHTGSAGFRETASGFCSSNIQYDGFSLLPGSGTITGTLRVYGYNNGSA